MHTDNYSKNSQIVSSEIDLFRLNILHEFERYFSNELKGVVLFGSRVNRQSEYRYRDLDLMILLSSMDEHIHDRLTRVINSLHNSESKVSSYLAHPPLVLSPKSKRILNPFLARIITDYGVIWQKSNELIEFLHELKNWATNSMLTRTASVLAADSLFFMEQYSLPFGNFLDKNKLETYFSYHFYRWLQATIWYTKEILCATKEDSLCYASSLLPNLQISSLNILAIKEYIETLKGRKILFLNCNISHEENWRDYA